MNKDSSGYTPPIEYTESFSNFQLRHIQALHFFFFLEQFRTDQPGLDSSARQALENHYQEIAEKLSPELKSQMEKQQRRFWVDGDQPHEVLESHLTFILEMLYCRATDDYMHFISELLSEVFRKYPMHLKGDKSIKYSELLQFSNMSELLKSITDKYINEFSYLGFRKLSQSLEKELHFKLTLDEAHLEEVVFFNEIRNIFVHNGGVITSALVETAHGKEAEVGGSLLMTGELFMAAMNLFWNMAIHADRQAISKWRLPLAKNHGQALFPSPKRKFELKIANPDEPK